MRRQPRIIHVISDLDCYGAAHSLRLLLKSEAARAWDLRVVALAGGAQACEDLARQGVRCEVLQRRWPFDPIAVGRLASRLWATAPDLVHVWDEASLAYVRLARLACPVCPLVATLREVPRPEGFFTGLFSRFSNQTVRYVAGSQTLQKKLLQWGVEQNGESQNKEHETPIISLIPPGILPFCVDTPMEREDFLAGLALAKDARLIVLVGPLTKQEPLEEAIWNFELVRTLHPEARLLVVGEGPGRHRLERFARLASDAQSVLFLGNRADVSAILQHADVFWQPTEADVPAAALLEAMAAGVPVVAADCLAHRELIEEERCGLLAPAGSRADWGRTTDRLLNDATLAQRLGVAGCGRVLERFSEEAMIRSYDQLYQLKGRR